MIPLIIVLVVIVLLALGAVGIYNGLIKLRNLVQEAWRQIDVELKRRHDLIGNLVEYAAHERGTLEDVMTARSAAMSGGQGPAAQAASEGLLSQALGRLIAVAEAYPDLKANQNFLALQNELTSTEDRIASARRYYNANVRALNTKVESVPSNVVAGMFSIKREEYFEVEGLERDTVKVDFGQSRRGTRSRRIPRNSRPRSLVGSPFLVRSRVSRSHPPKDVSRGIPAPSCRVPSPRWTPNRKGAQPWPNLSGPGGSRTASTVVDSRLKASRRLSAGCPNSTGPITTARVMSASRTS